MNAAAPTGKPGRPAPSKFRMEVSEDGQQLTIHIDGYLGWSHNKQELRYYLEGRKFSLVTLDIASDGGDPLATQKMMNYLEAYRKKTGCIIESIFTAPSASSATFLGLVANKGYRRMVEYTSNNYHQPKATLDGTVEEIETALETFRVFRENIMGIYQANSTLSREELDELFNQDVYISAERCLEIGFIDEIVPVSYAQMTEMLDTTARYQMAGTSFETPKKILITQHKTMKNLIDLLMQKGSFKREDLEGRTEEELRQLLAEAPDATPSSDGNTSGWLARMKSLFTPAATAPAPQEGPSSEELRMQAVREEVAGLTNTLKTVTDRLAGLEQQLPAAHSAAGTPSPAPFAMTTGAMAVVGANRGRIIMNRGRREQPFVDQTGPWGFIKGEKPKMGTSMDGLNSIEKLYMQLQGQGVLGTGISMSSLGIPPNAFDVSEVVSELGAHSTQIIYELIYEKKRYDNLAEAFTVEAGLKHRRWEIEGIGGNVSQNFAVKPVMKTDAFSWEIHKREVHGCMAAVTIDAYEFARTYFGRLQRQGFDPYNYPAAMMIMEMLADCIKSDLAEAVVKAERDDAVTGTAAATHLTMLNGLKKTAADILTAATGGLVAIATGDIYGSSADFHHNIALKMRNGIDPQYKDDPLAIYCAPDFVEAYQAEQDDKYIATAQPEDHFAPISRMARVRRTNSVLVGLNGLRGSKLMVATPKDNARVSFDLEEDLDKLVIREVGLAQEIYVPYQAGFNFRRVSPRYLAINDQV